MLGSRFVVSCLANHATDLSNVCNNLPPYLTCSSSASGRSCLLADQGAIAVTNLFDGVDCYNFTDNCLVDSFRTTITENVISPIISDCVGSLIIGGSCGAVQVLRPFPAITTQTLELECEYRDYRATVVPETLRRWKDCPGTRDYGLTLSLSLVVLTPYNRPTHLNPTEDAFWRPGRQNLDRKQ